MRNILLIIFIFISACDTGSLEYKKEKVDKLKKSLAEIYSEIDKLEKSEISVSYFSSFKEVYIWFILLGFVFIILSELSYISLAITYFFDSISKFKLSLDLYSP